MKILPENLLLHLTAAQTGWKAMQCHGTSCVWARNNWGFVLLSTWMFFMFSVEWKGQEPRACACAIWAALDNVSATELQLLSLTKVTFSCCLLSGFPVKKEVGVLAGSRSNASQGYISPFHLKTSVLVSSCPSRCSLLHAAGLLPEQRIYNYCP